MKTLRLERLTEAHLPAVLEIEHASNSAPWSEKSFRNELDHPHGIFLVAIGDGEVVGYGGIWLVGDEAHVTNVAVKPEVRRQGVARKLMIELLTQAKERGMTCSTLEVRAGNEAALNLYENLGYIKTAVRKGYYPDNREDAAVMWMYHLEDWSPKDH
jgi:[ribosomal protein S18]-alanine N-acetyltransferase